MAVNRERFSHFTISTRGSGSVPPSPAFSADGDFVPLYHRRPLSHGARSGPVPLHLRARGYIRAARAALSTRTQRKLQKAPKEQPYEDRVPTEDELLLAEHAAVEKDKVALARTGSIHHQYTLDAQYWYARQEDVYFLPTVEEEEAEEEALTCPSPLIHGVPTFRYPSPAASEVVRSESGDSGSSLDMDEYPGYEIEEALQMLANADRVAAGIALTTDDFSARYEEQDAFTRSIQERSGLNLPRLLPLTGRNPLDGAEHVLDDRVWRVLQNQPRSRLEERRRLEAEAAEREAGRWTVGKCVDGVKGWARGVGRKVSGKWRVLEEEKEEVMIVRRWGMGDFPVRIRPESCDMPDPELVLQAFRLEREQALAPI